MEWIKDYQLFLFDFDGLLVNTEEIHFQAYKNVCQRRGFDLNWDFSRYCQHAHYDYTSLQQAIYAYFPELQASEPDWSVIYAQKQQEMIDLLNQGAAQLMPGAEKLLKALAKEKIKSCVVTHSPDEFVHLIRKDHPILDTIPYWITRHHYSHPKPHPECYLTAIAKYAKETDRVIGFEDTPRGLRALLETRARPILISRILYPELGEFLKRGVLHYRSLEDLLEKRLL